MLTLVIPGLIWPRQALADIAGDLSLPAFHQLLGRGRLHRLPPCGVATVLGGLCGIAAPLPVAALRRLALRDEADDADWLCLDPVRLNFHERSMIVDEPRHLDLDTEEAAALAVSLAPTFSALGRIEVLAPGAWNLRLAAAAPTFRDLTEAAGRSASPLPSGPAYAIWRQAINEAQMILHAHPVNLARRKAGRPLVNSLWPWGGGRLPARRSASHDALWADDPLAAGVARLLGIQPAALPTTLPPDRPRDVLALVDALAQPARGGDALAWRDEALRIEAGWLAPALDALRTGRLDELRLIAPGEPGGAELRVGRHDLWKFWRKPRPLTELAPQ